MSSPLQLRDFLEMSHFFWQENEMFFPLQKKKIIRKNFNVFSNHTRVTKIVSINARQQIGRL